MSYQHIMSVTTQSTTIQLSQYHYQLNLLHSIEAYEVEKAIALVAATI